LLSLLIHLFLLSFETKQNHEVRAKRPTTAARATYIAVVKENGGLFIFKLKFSLTLSHTSDVSSVYSLITMTTTTISHYMYHHSPQQKRSLPSDDKLPVTTNSNNSNNEQQQQQQQQLMATPSDTPQGSHSPPQAGRAFK
jgi:hypothetical protein